jgi:hypothetical protein
LAGLLGLLGLGLAIGLTGGSSRPSYQERVGALCTGTSAEHRADISQLRGATGAAERYSQSGFAAQLFRVLLREGAAFDTKLAAINPPPALQSAQERYLRLDREDAALYGPVIRELARRRGARNRRGARDLATTQRRVTKNELELRGLLRRLGGTPCVTNPPGLG